MLKRNRIAKLLCILLFLQVSLFFLCNATWAVSVGWLFVVDDGDPGYSETGQAWVTYTYPEAYNGDYRYLSHLEHTVERKGTANWKMNIPTTGIYQVDIHFRPTENRTSDADYHVYDGDGEIHEHSINQTYSGVISSAGWHTLGDYSWNAGHTAKVVLDGTDDDLSDEADAVRWILLEKGPDAVLDVPLNAISMLLLNDGGFVHLTGGWVETGGYVECPVPTTYLETSISYTGDAYVLNKRGLFQESNCALTLVQNWQKTLSPTGEMVDRNGFTAMMGEVFSQAVVSTLSFSTNRIVYQIDHPMNGIQIRMLERSL